MVLDLRAGASSLSNGTQPVRGDGLISLNDDIVSLATTHVQPFGFVWSNGNEIGSNDGHLVVIKVKGVHILDGSVDESESMLLAGLELPESVLASACTVLRSNVVTVEKVVGGWGSTKVSNTVSLLESGDAKRIVNHDRTHVQVIVRCGRTVDDDWATNTLAVLSEKMAVIPSGTIRGSVELVSLGGARND